MDLKFLANVKPIIVNQFAHNFLIHSKIIKFPQSTQGNKQSTSESINILLIVNKNFGHILFSF